jgi:phosphinothricin acetyltransferase
MLTIRYFERTDFGAVKEIYQQGIDAGNATFETKTKEWDEWNASMLETCRLIAVLDEQVIGWAALSAVSTRPVYAGVAEVSVYVAEDARGKGVGNVLLSSLISDSLPLGC